MEYRPLGKTDIKVSVICLGTMTWGEQNTEKEAHEQMDMAVDYGINFFDTAELYPVPPKAETQGATEEHIGNWFEARGNRDKIILATKVVGRSNMEWFRGEQATLSRAHIVEAIEGSLRRLKTDYIDLYQLHWPDRSTNMFGQLGYNHKPDDASVSIKETLEALHDLHKVGKIRYVGISNETPWGLMEYVRLADQYDLPRAVSIQNPYSLLNRTFEVGLAEPSIREQVGLLAYSPLAFGVLSGKYLDGARPEGARITLYERFQRYNNDKANAATKHYVALAKENGLDPAQMALAFVNRQPFVTSNIIGATTMEQLKSNIESIDVTLSDDVLSKIESIHTDIPNPCP